MTDAPNRVVGMTFERWEAETPDLPGSVRRELLDYVPERRDECWPNLAWQVAEETERRRRDPLLYDELPEKRRSPHHGTPTSTSTGSGRVEFSHDDPLRRIPAAVYLPALTGELVSSSGRTRCPMPDHEDLRPSANAYGTKWCCFSCGAGGSVIDLASAIYGIAPRGRGYWELRDLIVEALDGAPLNLEEDR